MNEPVISGTLKVGEANRVGADLARRVRGSALPFYGLLILMMLVLFPLGYWLAELSNIPVNFGIIGAGAVSYVVFRFVWRRSALSRFRKRFASRGLPLELPLRMQIGAETLTYEVGDVTTVARWPAVTELYLKHGYWIFLVQASAFFAPQHFFCIG